VSRVNRRDGSLTCSRAMARLGPMKMGKLQ
jgi:hypothetical protein